MEWSIVDLDRPDDGLPALVGVTILVDAASMSVERTLKREGRRRQIQLLLLDATHRFVSEKAQLAPAESALYANPKLVTSSTTSTEPKGPTATAVATVGTSVPGTGTTISGPKPTTPSSAPKHKTPFSKSNSGSLQAGSNGSSSGSSGGLSAGSNW